MTGKVVSIKVIGVGGAGNNVVNSMIASNLEGVDMVVVNTDMQDLNKSNCPTKVQIGEKITGGMGAGAKPEIGQKAAEESKAAIAQVLEGTDMVFVTAGMGGGTGTGAAPVVAGMAHDAGILTVAVVTKPFSFEGKARMSKADAGIAELASKVDSLIIIPNERLKYVSDQKITVANAFGIADGVLRQAVESIAELVNEIKAGCSIGTIAVYLLVPLMILTLGWKQVFNISALFGILGKIVPTACQCFEVDVCAPIAPAPFAVAHNGKAVAVCLPHLVQVAVETIVYLWYETAVAAVEVLGVESVPSYRCEHLQRKFLVPVA